ncbi:MAG: cyclopropane fatty acyl phospholipid synthase [Gammaproteobacteria bacterium]
MADVITRPGGGFRPSWHGRGRSLLEAPYARLLASAGIRIDGPLPWDMRVHEQRLWRRVLLAGTRGLGDAYVAGWWDADRLDQFFARLVRARVDTRAWNVPKRLLGLFARFANWQRPAAARRVGEQHYDLPCALYRAMLDPRLVYSCGYWAHASTLAEAQEHKLELVCRKLELARGMRVLDIGCGWGSFAAYAAERYGVEVTGITISREQAEVARRACRGLPVDILLGDYRELRGRYDRVVSIGMFEHVGRRNYRRYLSIVRDCLADDGLFLLHSIGLPRAGSGIDPWVTAHIFPNSEVPTAPRLVAAAEDLFRIEDWHAFGADYDRTLMAWHDNFNAAWPALAAQFEPGFARLWRYYLLMFAGVFRARGLDLWQLVLTPPRRAAQYRRPAW